MGKQGPRPNSLSFDASSGLKEYELRWSAMLLNGDPSRGRDRAVLVKGFKNEYAKFSAGKGVYSGKRHTWWLRRHMRSVIFTLALLGFFLVLDSFMFSYFDPTFLNNSPTPPQAHAPKDINAADDANGKGPVMYSRLVQMASVSLAKRDLEQKVSKFWKETHHEASTWRPCADKNQKRAGTAKNTTGFVLVSANGGLNQQRVAVCNAVAVASLLNATLVIPKFLYSNVWKDPSQFSDIYQEETFMNMLKDDVDIVKELPPHLKSTDFEAVGSLVTDADLSKEASPEEYIRNIFPILSRNGVVHFLGFGNRLGFESLPSDLQKLRCKCNFHALKFAPKIQKLGALLVKRITNYGASRSLLDRQLLGRFISTERIKAANPSKYLALHLRFEVDMVAYSMCDFGGGERERRQLQAYREEHFPLLLQRLKRAKPPSPTELRKIGRCPLTPEEAALVLAALGFDRGTYIYLAGSQIYGGESRMLPLVSLYPNLVTKEDLLSPTELQPFRNFSSQLAALDFIACGVSDVFAITDSGSQLSSLVSGFRTYYGGGDAPMLRPSKKRLAAILQENSTIRWHSFEKRVRKMIEEGQRVTLRRPGRSIYRQPRCRDCMCSDDEDQ
ncbi:LOW QUALITY PROTEIN: O-fucosyltransferase 8-like [Salvia miltiorrhiza]|uniref:LOW QUALITY PROTEIN: O-fucosyltransferase 8-like n=1 Tax=Salvia miltiorrhiza TaxID=226208 RepID=UPI0025AC01B0|nr:LOW QUALITY PROTEIN: O-fucosyltransferase 8-like [Salvia miltiorrhiza]